MVDTPPGHERLLAKVDSLPLATLAGVVALFGLGLLCLAADSRMSI